jgi:hypothetical protein
VDSGGPERGLTRLTDVGTMAARPIRINMLENIVVIRLGANVGCADAVRQCGRSCLRESTTAEARTGSSEGCLTNVSKNL